MSKELFKLTEWNSQFREHEGHEHTITITGFCGDISLKKTLSKDRRCIQITMGTKIRCINHIQHIFLTRLQAMDLALTIQKYYNS